MRGIKFRAWVDEKSKWIGAKDVGMFIGFSFGSVESGYDEANIYCEDGRTIEEPQWDKIIFMQYTGLKDKNGKEIFEGDIVKMVQDKIIPKYAICEVKWREEYAGFNFSHILLENVVNAGDGWSMLTHKNWEIIGNIYENPELLK